MTENKRFEVHKLIEGFPIAVDLIDSYAKELVEQGKDLADVTIDIHDNYRKQIDGYGKNMTLKECCELLNELHDENEQLKQQLKTKAIVTKHYEDFVRFRIKLIEVLQKNYDYASNQRQKNLDDVIIAYAYDVLRVTVKGIADDMGVDLE